MKNCRMGLLGIFIMLTIGLLGCAGTPPTYNPPDVIDYPMGNGVHCYTWRDKLECLQVKE